MSTTMTATTERPGGLDEMTEARLASLAEAEGIPREEALAMALHVGLEFCESHAVERHDRLETLAAEVADIKACLHLVGRTALASNLLLAHWAAKSGGVRVAEEELTRELEAVGRSRWAAQIAALGLPCPVDEIE